MNLDRQAFLALWLALAAGAVGGCTQDASTTQRGAAAHAAPAPNPPAAAAVASSVQPAQPTTTAPESAKEKSSQADPTVKEERAGDLVIRSSSKATFGPVRLLARKGDEIHVIANSAEEWKQAREVESVAALASAFRLTPAGLSELAPQGVDHFTGSLAISYGQEKVTRKIVAGRIEPAVPAPATSR